MFVSVSAWFGFIDAAIEASWRIIAHIEFHGGYRPWVRETNKSLGTTMLSHLAVALNAQARVSISLVLNIFSSSNR